MPRNPFLSAALAAADRDWSVFPLVPGGKAPVIRDWEQRATSEEHQIYRWGVTPRTTLGSRPVNRACLLSTWTRAVGTPRRSGSPTPGTGGMCWRCSPPRLVLSRRPIPIP